MRIRFFVCVVLMATCAVAVSEEQQAAPAHPKDEQISACNNLIRAQKNKLTALEVAYQAKNDLITSFEDLVDALKNNVSALQTTNQTYEAQVANRNSMIAQYERRVEIDGDMISKQKESIRLLKTNVTLLKRENELLRR